MSRFAGLLGVLAVLAASMGFAALNGGQRVTLRLGIATFYRVPLTVVVFGAVIGGMLVMLAASIRSDLRVRKILRERLVREDEEERARMFVDRAQRDLFEAPEPGRERPVGGPGRVPPIPVPARGPDPETNTPPHTDPDPGADHDRDFETDHDRDLEPEAPRSES